MRRGSWDRRRGTEDNFGGLRLSRRGRSRGQLKGQGLQGRLGALKLGETWAHVNGDRSREALRGAARREGAGTG